MSVRAAGCAPARLAGDWHSTVSVLRSATTGVWQPSGVWRPAVTGVWCSAAGGDWRLALGGRLEKLGISHQPPQNDPLFVYLGLFSTSLDLFFAGFAVRFYAFQNFQILGC